MHRKLASALKPGGHLFLEAYSKAQLAYGTGGPPNKELLYALDDLREDFSDLELRERRAHRGPGPNHGAHLITHDGPSHPSRCKSFGGAPTPPNAKPAREIGSLGKNYVSPQASEGPTQFV